MSLSRERFVLDFPETDPQLLWALVSDTNRTARAMGLVAGRFRTDKDASGRPVLIGEGKQLGFDLAWVSGPDSWIAGRWFRGVRRFSKGPVREGVDEFWIERLGQGTRLTVERSLDGQLPAVLFDRLIGGRRLRRYLQDAAAAVARLRPSGDPEADLGRSPTVRLDRLIAEISGESLCGTCHLTNQSELALRAARLEGARLDPALRDRLLAHLRDRPDEEVAILSPQVLASRWGAPRREVLRLLLHAAHVGLLELHWGLRCQACQVRGAEVGSLSDLPDHAQCPGCGAVFGPDLALHVEATFSVHRAIRPVEQQTFCTAGASNRPHVFAQLLVGPDAPGEIPLDVLEGEFVVRSLGRLGVQLIRPQVDRQLGVVLRADGVHLETLAPGAKADVLPFRSEVQGPSEIVLLERVDWGAEWVSAALLASVPEFYAFFSEAPRSRHEVSVGTLTILFSDLRGSTALYQKVGDARAFNLVQDHFDRLTQVVEQFEGALVKTMGDAVMAVFQSPVAGMRAALAMLPAIEQSEAGGAGLGLKLGLHSGSCLAVRANERLDFFGHAVNLTARAQAQSKGSDIVIADAILEHPGVAELLTGCSREPFEAVLKGIEKPQRLWRLKPGG